MSDMTSGRWLRVVTPVVVLLAIVAASFAGSPPETGSAASPAPVVAVYGDSLVDAASDYLGWFYGIRGMVVEFHYWGGTAPCDFFGDMRSWPTPAIAVMLFGGNTLTQCTQNRGTPEQVYAEDFETAASIFESRAVELVWMSTPGLVGTTEAENWVAELMQQTAARHGQLYVNAADVLTRDSVYVPWQPCQQADYNDDNCYLGVVLIRADDGIHLRPSGARRWAERIVNATPLPSPDRPPPPPPYPVVPVQRIHGQDAIGTSLAVSHAQFASGQSANAVVLARSDHFADALAGGPLAALQNAPLLITPGAPLSGTLDPRVLSEIQRVLPAGKTVYILGGPLAIAPGIDGTLQTLGFTVTRVQGANQYATAVAIAGRLGSPNVIFEATGLHFADSLSAVPAAIRAHGAILLTNGNVQAPETVAYLAAHPSAVRYAIGGPLAAAGADPGAIPVWGQDLFGTSAAVARWFFLDATTFGAATGFDFPDALSGGVFMGNPNHLGPMLLLTPYVPIPTSISDYLTQATDITHGYIFGGPLAVGDDVAGAL